MSAPCYPKRGARTVHALLATVASLVLLACDNSSPDPVDPTIPVLLAPGPGATVDNGCYGSIDVFEQVYDWSDVAGADAYHLRVWRTGANLAIDRSDLTASEYVDVSHGGWVDDEHLDSWQWMVRARVDGVWHDWSEARPFVEEPLDTDCP